jgi:hypothetical protein
MPRKRRKDTKFSIPKRRSKRVLKDNGDWKLVPLHEIPFLAIPPELHIRILELLNPIDAVCLSLVKFVTAPVLYRSYPANRSSKYMFTLLAPFTNSIPLSIGAPDSQHPVIKGSGCHHCVPVLFYPAHCELQFHLRSLIPPQFKYCARCEKFTKCEDKGFSDSEKFCGGCGVTYWRRFERGRRMIDMERQGEKQRRLRKYYNVDVGTRDWNS